MNTNTKNVKKEKNTFFEIFFVIVFSIYTFYCVYHQGSLVRGIGWRTKKEYPLSYIITIICGIILPVGIIVKYIIKYKRSKKILIKKI